MMLGMGFHPDAGEGYNGIPLQTASAEGHQSIVELLLEKGADVNRRSGFFGTALQNVCSEVAP